MKAIILSMTEKERTHPEIINPSRKKRIAAGSGQTIEDVNRLLSQFKQMQRCLSSSAASAAANAAESSKCACPRASTPRSSECNSVTRLIHYIQIYNSYILEEFYHGSKIRLRRMGAKKAPFYRIVVADSRYPRDGRFIEEIGTYNPVVSPVEIKVDAEKAKQWIANGAQPTDTVKALLKRKASFNSIVA